MQPKYLKQILNSDCRRELMKTAKITNKIAFNLQFTKETKNLAEGEWSNREWEYGTRIVFTLQARAKLKMFETGDAGNQRYSNAMQNG